MEDPGLQNKRHTGRIFAKSGMGCRLNEERDPNPLTEVGLKVWVDIHVLAPLNHTFEDGHQTLKALFTQAELLLKPQKQYEQ